LRLLIFIYIYLTGNSADISLSFRSYVTEGLTVIAWRMPTRHVLCDCYKYRPVFTFQCGYSLSGWMHLWQIWENFHLGVGDMCTRRGVKTQPCDGTAYSASHSLHL